MKSNIDLTENFDFAIPRRASTSSSSRVFRNLEISTVMWTPSYNKSIGKYLSKYILDIPYCINEDIEHKQSGGLVQGNGNRRKFMEYENNPGCFCERCGRKKKYPWEDFSRLLCPKCEKYLESEMRAIPWRR